MQFPKIDPIKLAIVVRRATASDTARLDDWACEAIDYGQINSVSAGLYTVSGTATDVATNQTFDWTVILKVIRPLEDGSVNEATHWNYWKREALAYESGLLIDLPGDLVAPRCFGVDEQEDGCFWIWLEVIDNHETQWSLDRYGLASSHLGQFQGAYLSGQRPMPSQDWLSREWLRTRVAQSANAMTHIHDPVLWNHPIVRRTCSTSIADDVTRLWNERNIFLDALDKLPQTLCHLDIWRPNLFGRTLPDGREQTVAIDWSYLGLAAIGSDIGNLVPDSLGNFDVDISDAECFEERVFEGYLAGLRDAGWTGDPRHVRFGYAASSALGWGLGTPWWLQWPQDETRRARVEKRWGRPLDELMSLRSKMTLFLLDRAEEARTLLPLL